MFNLHADVMFYELSRVLNYFGQLMPIESLVNNYLRLYRTGIAYIKL